MKYNLIIENTLKSLSSLTKVRIKTDPKYIGKLNDLSEAPDYIGYVLKEGLSKVKVLILPPDLSIEEIPIDLIEYISAEDKADVFTDLKRFAVEQLAINEEDPVFQQICNSHNIEELEIFLKQKGVSDEHIAELYKEFILT